MSEFVESLHEIFERLGRIQTRRMFGGHGVWHEGRMIALIAKDTLYLKSDADSAEHFDKLNLPPFTYERNGKTMPMSYRQAPADLFEDRLEAALWAAGPTKRPCGRASRQSRKKSPPASRPPRKHQQRKPQ
ncbi:TfoX/Sxy family protein [Variovorax sp. CCNWLW186]|uniref:TfoX/Sxy family protein n=1 Tax=Variovorax sp. CCNWLW186 TaxID=3127473 RepID=UPI0030770195